MWGGGQQNGSGGGSYFLGGGDGTNVPSRSALSVLALVVAVSLIGAPVTMHDWTEKAYIGAAPVENESEVDDETPIIQFESLSPNAQPTVRDAIERGDGVIYGTEDQPDRFSYTDLLGRYVVVYEGQKYELRTAGEFDAGMTPLEIALQLPFVGYGLFLLYVRREIGRDDLSRRTPAAFVGVGAAFHLLGPEFDFPLLGPEGFSVLGFVAFLVIGGWSIRDAL